MLAQDQGHKWWSKVWVSGNACPLIAYKLDKIIWKLDQGQWHKWGSKDWAKYFLSGP
jgi:hypothetical protein